MLVRRERSLDIRRNLPGEVRCQVFAELTEGSVCLHWTAYTLHSMLEKQAKLTKNPALIAAITPLMKANETHTR